MGQWTSLCLSICYSVSMALTLLSVQDFQVPWRRLLILHTLASPSAGLCCKFRV